MTSKNALLILGHGSRDPLSNQEFMDFTRMFMESYPSYQESTTLTHAFLELCEPSIPQALESLARDGFRKILTIPYFLFRAGHVKSEIPEMIDHFTTSHPEISVLYGKSLWPHPNLVELSVQRIQTVIQSQSLQDCDILVVGRGATDPEAIEQFKEATQEIERNVPCNSFRHSFIALSEPKFIDVLEEMLQNETPNLLIFPFYLFTGILVNRIQMQAQKSMIQYPKKNIVFVPHFGLDPLMFEILQERIEEITK